LDLLTSIFRAASLIEISSGGVASVLPLAASNKLGPSRQLLHSIGEDPLSLLPLSHAIAQSSTTFNNSDIGSMIIRSVTSVRTVDRSAFAWSGLRRSQNVELVTQRIIDVQGVPTGQYRNARKQASQIRYCLIQAHEYFRAAAEVSLATKPNLLYYGLMSLALAEILFKQSGGSSLDKARGENRHHGLSMTVGGAAADQPLSVSAGALRAKPMTVGGQRRGTFELWHRSSREHPIIGRQTHYVPTGGSTSGHEILLAPVDQPYETYPEEGITLAEALSCLPFLLEHIAPSGLASKLVRGTATAEHRGGERWNSRMQILLHPNDLNSEIIDQIKVEPGAVDRVSCLEIVQGYEIVLKFDWINQGMQIPLPAAAMINTKEFRMWSNQPPLNEFGYFYIALYLAGNYARYYPDKWLHDVTNSSPLALAIEELCDIATWRVPWLTLSEMDMSIYVQEV
jgi:hypothetical protein